MENKNIITVKNNGARHDLTVDKVSSGYAIYVDGELRKNEAVVNAYGGSEESFERMMQIYKLGGNPVVSESQSRLTLALLFAVNQKQYAGKEVRG